MVKVSIYSGKCDCYDSIVGIHQYTDEELKNNVKFYIGDKQLNIKSRRDLIPYYPYLIGLASFNNKERCAVIHLSSESYVDREERERLEFYLQQILRIYNRCKRKKIEFNVEDVIKEVYWITNIEAIEELVKRVAKYGKKASVDGIHLTLHEMYRQELADEMVKNGFNLADYGMERFG